MSDPRNNADDAYEVFMAMPQSEWLGLLGSLIQGGVLQPAEREGFERAAKDRAEPRVGILGSGVASPL